MPERSRKRRTPPPGQDAAAPEPKDPLAAELGRRGGMKGGRARAESLSPELRRAIAQRAAAMRWAKRRAETEEQPRLPATPRADKVATVQLAGWPLQVSRLEGGRRLVGQLSVETVLGEALPPDVAMVLFHVPGEWQLHRGLAPEALAGLLARRAAAGHKPALDLLAACAVLGVAGLIDEAVTVRDETAGPSAA